MSRFLANESSLGVFMAKVVVLFALLLALLVVLLAAFVRTAGPNRSWCLGQVCLSTGPARSAPIPPEVLIEVGK